MKIVFSPQVAMTLEYITGARHGNEFSGFGFVERVDSDFLIYDFELLNIGSWGFTQIKPEKTLELLSRQDAGKLKAWIHRHPIGSGKPGIHNWSGTDNQTIEETPLGGIPEMVKWSISVVRTPLGWVGRVDNHLTKETLHVAVEPNITQAVIDEVRSLAPGVPNERDEDEAWYWSDEDDWELDGEDPYADDHGLDDVMNNAQLPLFSKSRAGLTCD